MQEYQHRPEEDRDCDEFAKREALHEIVARNLCNDVSHVEDGVEVIELGVREANFLLNAEECRIA